MKKILLLAGMLSLSCCLNAYPSDTLDNQIVPTSSPAANKEIAVAWWDYLFTATDVRKVISDLVSVAELYIADLPSTTNKDLTPSVSSVKNLRTALNDYINNIPAHFKGQTDQMQWAYITLGLLYKKYPDALVGLCFYDMNRPKNRLTTQIGEDQTSNESLVKSWWTKLFSANSPARQIGINLSQAASRYADEIDQRIKTNSKNPEALRTAHLESVYLLILMNYIQDYLILADVPDFVTLTSANPNYILNSHYQMALEKSFSKLYNGYPATIQALYPYYQELEKTEQWVIDLFRKPKPNTATAGTVIANLLTLAKHYAKTLPPVTNESRMSYPQPIQVSVANLIDCLQSSSNLHATDGMLTYKLKDIDVNQPANQTNISVLLEIFNFNTSALVGLYKYANPAHTTPISASTPFVKLGSKKY